MLRCRSRLRNSLQKTTDDVRSFLETKGRGKSPVPIWIVSGERSPAMKIKKFMTGLFSAVLAISMMGSMHMPVQAAGPAQVTINVKAADSSPLQGARKVGANIEMSMISDDMWQANGNWIEQCFFASEINMMRWGYDAWAFDWEQEIPLSSNRYWGGLNSRDAAGTFGLVEFIEFCKEQGVIPFVMIPIESLDAFGGEASLEKVKELTASMAEYIAQEGIELCYFDMGNEPWNNGAGGVDNAKYLGSLFPEFQQIVKAANPNYRLVLQRAPENILWNSWNNALVSAAQGAFDAYDDHRYAFYGWNKYFDEKSDALLTPGTPIEGKEGILGECNIGWTPVQDNWDEGHVRDMGGSMALLNAMLEMIGDGRYSHIVSWPSHYPSKASITGCPNNAFGWFDLDQWYLDGETVRFTGPAIVHRIINQNVLENRLGAASSADSVRVYAFSNEAQTDLRIIVLNKWDAAQLTLNVPEQMNHVSAMVMSGKNVWDTSPEYKNLFTGFETVTGGSYVGNIPAESVVVYTFGSETFAAAPQQTSLIFPQNGTADAGTAQAFAWNSVEGARNYHLTVSANADLSEPIIDTDTGTACRYQASRELALGTVYYWQVTASNPAGSTISEISCFTTVQDDKAGIITLNNDSVYMSYSANWNQQSSGGSYRNDDAACNEKDGYVEFTFTGTGAKLYGIKGNWCGMADVRVDFGPAVQIDTYAETTEEQALIFDTGELPYGEHTVTLTVAGTKNGSSSGTWIEFDKAELYDSQNGAPVINKVVWNDENPNLKKFSIWKHQSVPGSYHDDDSSSNTWKAYIEFSFDGTNAVIYGLKAPWCGMADITVDGKKVAAIDTYASETMLQQVLYDTGILESGTHTVRITVTSQKSSESSGKWIEVDKVVWQ